MDGSAAYIIARHNARRGGKKQNKYTTTKRGQMLAAHGGTAIEGNDPAPLHASVLLHWRGHLLCHLFYVCPRHSPARERRTICFRPLA